MSKIIYVPLDERPCNYIYPQFICKIGDCNIIELPKKYLGNFKKPADIDAIWNWLFENIGEADYGVISMDMLIYGGIVPSRLHHLNSETCKKRIDNIKKLKEINPKIKLFAFQLITRAPARNGSVEEPDYYEEHGYNIYKYGYLQDKKDVIGLEREEANELIEIENSIPEKFLDDFLKRRKINFENNLYTIDTLEYLDFFVIPIDDCKPYGYASSERKKIGNYLSRQNKLSKVMMYPGADEIGCTLMARALNEINNKSPNVYLDYTSKVGKYSIPAYEDRCICETLGYHIEAVGATEVFNPNESDIIICVNTPTTESLSLESKETYNTVYLEKERNFFSFIKRLKEYSTKNKVLAVADCAIANKCDRALMQFLKENNMLRSIQAFAGWNTSSNTFGTTLAHAMAVNLKGESQISKEFLSLRYLEDWGYMTIVREKVTKKYMDVYNLHKLYNQEHYNIVKEEIYRELKKYMDDIVALDFSVEIPWHRMFEIHITLK
ncbi:MAG: DUF4127 family protein [Lachnospirales bacterium]